MKGSGSMFGRSTPRGGTVVCCPSPDGWVSIMGLDADGRMIAEVTRREDLFDESVVEDMRQLLARVCPPRLAVVR